MSFWKTWNEKLFNDFERTYTQCPYITFYDVSHIKIAENNLAYGDESIST